MIIRKDEQNKKEEKKEEKKEDKQNDSESIQILISINRMSCREDVVAANYRTQHPIAVSDLGGCSELSRDCWTANYPVAQING